MRSTILYAQLFALLYYTRGLYCTAAGFVVELPTG